MCPHVCVRVFEERSKTLVVTEDNYRGEGQNFLRGYSFVMVNPKQLTLGELAVSFMTRLQATIPARIINSLQC